MEDQEHLRRPAADAADADELLDDRLVVHLAPLRRPHRARLEVLGEIAEVFDLARRQPRGADVRRVEREHRVRREPARRPGGERDEAIPDRLRRLDRDLLADDRARQRREGVAAALEPAVAEARDELLHHPVALDEVLAGVVPEIGDEGRRGGSRHRAHPLTHVVPCAVSLRTTPSAASSSRIASAAAKSRARLASARAAIRAAMSASVSAEPACRKARGLCWSTPSVAPRAFSKRGIGRLATAIHLGGELEQDRDRDRRVEVVVHRLAEGGGARLAPVDLGRPVERHRVERGVEPAQRAPRVVEAGVAEVERAAVVRPDHEEADRLAVVALQHVADGEEVAERLRHLLVVDVEQPVVHPDVGERAAARAFALRDLVLVVRELQVLAAAVDVEVLAEERLAHRRALDVPARAAEAVRARPLGVVGLALLGRLPHHEVERILLAVEDGDALAGAQLVDRLARELAVAGELANGEVDVAVRAPVAEALLLERRDHLQHLRHVLRRARLVRRPLEAERVGVLLQRLDVLLGEGADRDAALERAPDDLVVDVGDVAHVGDAIADRLQPALGDVERQHEARVPHVAEVVDRDAADVEARVARLDRSEALGRAGQRVVDAKCHAAGSLLRTSRRLAHRREKGCRHRVRTLQSIQYSGPPERENIVRGTVRALRPTDAIQDLRRRVASLHCLRHARARRDSPTT